MKNKFLKNRKNKKTQKQTQNQEQKIKELCTKFKEQNPDASDKAVLTFAFANLYGKAGPAIVKKLLKDPEAFQKIREATNLDEKEIQETIKEEDMEEIVNAVEEEVTSDTEEDGKGI